MKMDDIMMMLLASGKWTPKKYGDDLIYWFEADFINGISDGDEIDTWINAADNGYDIAKETGNGGLIYKENIINGRPAAQGNGTQQLSRKETPTISQPSTDFVVWSTSSSANVYVTAGGNTDYRNNIFRSNGNVGIQAGISAAAYAKASFPFLVTTAIFNGNQSKVYENGQLKATVNPGTEAMRGLRIGASTDRSTLLSGYVAAYIKVAGIPSDIYMNQTHQYLSRKYGITLAAQ